MHRGAAEAPFPHRHLLGIEGLSPDDINHVLDLADGYVELNRQAEKKRSTLRGRTIVNCFFESSPARVRHSNSPASGSAATSSTCRCRRARWSRARP
jgi:aspartate carbamoyltransferase catalytic subunit